MVSFSRKSQSYYDSLVLLYLLTSSSSSCLHLHNVSTPASTRVLACHRCISLIQFRSVAACSFVIVCFSSCPAALSLSVIAPSGELLIDHDHSLDFRQSFLENFGPLLCLRLCLCCLIKPSPYNPVDEGTLVLFARECCPSTSYPARSLPSPVCSSFEVSYA